MLSFVEYQQRAHQTASYPAEHWEYPVIGLAGEVGELCNQVKKIIRDDGGLGEGLQENRRARIEDEMGDVLWYLAEICCGFGLDLERIAAANLDKLAARAQAGSFHGDARGQGK